MLCRSKAALIKSDCRQSRCLKCRGPKATTTLPILPICRSCAMVTAIPMRRRAGRIVASQDLPVLNPARLPVASETPAPELIDAPAATDTASVPEIAAQPIAMPQPVTAANAEPTLAEMVAQLEAAVAERQNQLDELEAVASELAATRPTIAAQTDRPEISIAHNDISTGPAALERPPLEAVPTASVQDDNIDSALAAALETLHRMNATGR